MNNFKNLFVTIISLLMLFCSCNSSKKTPVIFDTDANNELDDQHALAYLLYNAAVFDIKGITVNTTYNGGNIDEQYAEAKRVIQLCDWEGKTPLIKGANGSFEEIKKTLDTPDYDGNKAVDFIIKEAKKYTEEKLVVLAVGKLTNVALAVEKEPSIIENIRLVWLGSNYPEVSLFGQLNTNYSSLANAFTETGSQIVATGGFVTIDNQEVPVLRNETQFDSSKIDYSNQLNNNLSSTVGVAIRIPIFNSLQAKNRVKIRKIELEESRIEMENTRLLFKQSIEKAYIDMETAYNRYFIQLQQLEAYNESFRENEGRFENGVSNSVAYIMSKNNRDAAQLNLNRNKYEYLLRVKILNFYRGR
ncbi:nucleoside hydrolase [Flavobacteriaceae bacterium]|nr:nucleoside hydrolase [Flavobacteriaceae bacterium]